jgi:nicotinate-nucleotide adenylyltransferase
MKVGLLGGTFDPVHLGHLRVAAAAAAELALDRVLLAPVGKPPHRPAPAASPFDRYAMVALATAGQPRLQPSDVELRRGGPSYTVDTVRSLLQELAGARLFLVVGSDTLPEMAGWREAEEIFSRCAVAVFERPGAAGGGSAPAHVAVHRLSGSGLSVSASEVRQRAQAGADLGALVPGCVAEYIGKKGLYR